MSAEEIAKETDKINQLSRFEMARLWRFSPPGHIYFDSNLPFYDIFSKRFAELGGFSPEISKELGWL